MALRVRQKSIAADDAIGPCDRHSRKCTICRHPRRAEIEQAFLDWASPADIAKELGLGNAALYRHFHARSLFELRRRNLHIGLGRIAEHASRVEPTAANVIAAFVAMAKINSSGEWSASGGFDRDVAFARGTWDRAVAAVRDNDVANALAGLPTTAQGEQEEFRRIEHRLKALDALAANASAARAADAALDCSGRKVGADGVPEGLKNKVR